jgi:hypothetical protein
MLLAGKRGGRAGAICLLVAVAGGRAAGATELAPPAPPGAATPATEHRIRVGLLAGGAVTFGSSWLAAAFVGASVLAVEGDGCDRACSAPAPKDMFIPVAGPLLAGAQPGARVDLGFPSWVYPAWSVVEAAGLAMMVIGLIGHNVPQPESRPSLPALSVVPIMTKGLNAVALNVAW